MGRPRLVRTEGTIRRLRAASNLRAPKTSSMASASALESYFDRRSASRSKPNRDNIRLDGTSRTHCHRDCRRRVKIFGPCFWYIATTCFEVIPIARATAIIAPVDVPAIMSKQCAMGLPSRSSIPSRKAAVNAPRMPPPSRLRIRNGWLCRFPAPLAEDSASRVSSTNTLSVSVVGPERATTDPDNPVWISTRLTAHEATGKTQDAQWL